MKRISELGLVGIGAAFLLGSMSAHASILISVPSEAALAGSTGNSFDVTLTNTGPATVAIAGFRFQLLTTNTDITFTGGSFSTVAPYIFAGVSFDQDFSFTLDTLSGGQELDASDVSEFPKRQRWGWLNSRTRECTVRHVRQRGAGTSAVDAPCLSSHQSR